MIEKIKVVLIGNESEFLEEQRAVIANLGDIEPLVICSETIINVIKESVQNESYIVVINLTDQGLEELQFLESILNKKAMIIIVGDQSNIDLLSQALRSGVKDFIDVKRYEDKLGGVIGNIKRNMLQSGQVGRVSAMINVKGGSGASFIVSNVAYALAKEWALKVVLVDFDLQFGSISFNFDKTPKYALMEALNIMDDLDSLTLEAYMSKCNENLNLLLPSPVDVVLPGEVNLPNVQRLIELLRLNYSEILIDLPRLIDPVSNLILEQADEIILIVQQTLIHFRMARRLIQILNKDLDIGLDKIVIVINRYDSSNSLRIEDLKHLVNHDQVFTVANDFKKVVDSSNMGVPLYESSPRLKTSKDIKILAKSLAKIEFETPKKSIFNLFDWF